MATLTFMGAVTGVTGSMHLLETQGSRVLLDCGLYQGGREEEAHNEDPFPFAVNCNATRLPPSSSTEL